MRPRAIAALSLLAASACTDAATAPAPSAGAREEPLVAAFDSLWARYDATYPLEQSQLPLFRLLGAAEGDKRHVLLETGHDVRVQRAAMTRETLAWFDKYLGPVGH